jgi:hypothetical protein
MSVIGNLNDYVKFQMAEGMASGEGGGAANMASEMAIGFAMAQEMMKGMQHPPPATPHLCRAPRPPPPAPNPSTSSPRPRSPMLGVSPADVIATLEAGDLKGKKIGSSWRVTRAALDAYLAE